MENLEIEKVMDRKKIAAVLHKILDVSCELLDLDEFEAKHFAKIKVIRTSSAALNSSISMVQQETAQQRHSLILERMKQMGFNTPKNLK